MILQWLWRQDNVYFAPINCIILLYTFNDKRARRVTKYEYWLQVYILFLYSLLVNFCKFWKNITFLTLLAFKTKIKRICFNIKVLLYKFTKFTLTIFFELVNSCNRSLYFIIDKIKNNLDFYVFSIMLFKCTMMKVQ